MSKHTSGPLRVNPGQDGHLFVRDSEGRMIAGFSTSTGSDLMPEGEGEANAQLFIAALDMLVALKKLLDSLPRTGCYCGHGESCGVCSRSDLQRQAELIAEQAIKKAKGEL